VEILKGQGEIAACVTFPHKRGSDHRVSIDAKALAAVQRLQARGSAPADTTVREALDRACRKAKVQDLDPGNLRHSAVTWARQSGRLVRPNSGGLSHDEIAKVTGHTSTRTTQQHYDAALPPMLVTGITLDHRDDPKVS
jgi:integrase